MSGMIGATAAALRDVAAELVSIADQLAPADNERPPCARCKVRPELYFYDDGPEVEGLCAVCVVREPVEALIAAAGRLSERIEHAQRAHNYGDELAEPCWLPASADEWAACIRDWWDGLTETAARPLRTGWRGDSYGVIDE